RNLQHHVRPGPPFRRSAAHATEQRDRVESEVAQGARKQGVVLEAVAAAALVDELALDRVERDADGAASLDRDIVEQKRLTMRDVQAAERLSRRRQARGDADAAEIIVQTHDVYL